MKGYRIADRHADGYLLADLARILSLATDVCRDGLWAVFDVEAVGPRGRDLMALSDSPRTVSTSELLGLARRVTDIFHGEFVCEDPDFHELWIIVRFGSPDFVEVLSHDEEFLARLRDAFRDVTQFEEPG